MSDLAFLPEKEIKDLTVPKSYIRNIAIRLPESFRFVNAPHPVPKPDTSSSSNFIGHQENIDKFTNFLSSGYGVFLVTGYRGMGKTSFVNRVTGEFLNNVSKDNEKGNIKKPKYVIDIHLTLAQNSPKEIDILRLMTTSAYKVYSKWMEDKYDNAKAKKNKALKQSINDYRLIGSLSLLIFPILLLIKPLWLEDFMNIGKYGINVSEGISLFWSRMVSYGLLLISFGYTTYYLLTLAKNNIAQKKKDAKKKLLAFSRIELLNQRCYASTTRENQQGETKNSPSSIPFYNSFKNKRSLQEYPAATAKEIEYELQQFLTEAKTEHNVEFLFIFDELDKIDPHMTGTLFYDPSPEAAKQNAELSYQLDLRHRKEAVISVIAGLKNFLTSSDARFIFIAGREMFDASLADIADRQSSVSSIFTYIFNIESLLKGSEQGQSLNNGASLSHSIEQYVCKMFFPEKTDATKLYEYINIYYRLCTGVKGADGNEIHKALNAGEKTKLYFTIQNFINYLTYRSNGSPKKLIRAIQEMVIIKNIGNYQKNIILTDNIDKRDSGEVATYLYFNYYTQYKIGFLSYLYRPFLIQYGRSFKLYSDNLNVSTAYLFDHLLKYHPFAFSLTNLELIPEVLSSNKSPAIREHIRQIISHLSANHLRETEVSLFDYKFYSRTNNEIAFLSKISEQEAAAFNFTLDESHVTKHHMRVKIKELRTTYAAFAGRDEDGQIPQIYSIAHINGILGDLHFFDQEYDDAISAYADANRPINHLEMSRMNMRDFFTLIKNKLKQGLCFEKMGGFVDALAFYNDSCEDAMNYMTHKITTVDPPSQNKKHENKRDRDFHSSSLNDALELIVQCFLAKSIVQEKMGLEGLSGPKIFIDLGNFLSIVEKLFIVNSGNLITAQAFLMIGKLLYYKNSSTGFERIDEFRDYLPKNGVYDEVRDLLNTFPASKTGAKSPRKPLLAAYFYIMGLKEVLGSRHILEGHKEKPNFLRFVNSHKNMSYGVLQTMEEILYDKNNQRYTGIHFGQMGAFLSNIGDSLLSMFQLNFDEKRKDNFIRSITIEQIFSLKNYGSQESQKENMLAPERNIFLKHLNPSTSESLEMADILRCYYLSGQYYQKHGKSHSCSFQLRKILWVLRLVLQDSKTDTDTFLNFLQETIVSPALKITSQNADYTGNHIINKAESYGIESGFVMNNISNHPETREIILLFNYIRIKLGRHVKIRTLISPFNSFASQYSRILELDFFSKYTYNLYLKACIDPKDKKEIWTPRRLRIAREYLFSMHSILRILKIYGTDFIAGNSYYAYSHYRVATFLESMQDAKTTKGKSVTGFIREYINYIIEEKTFTSTDPIYHYNMASEMYSKTIQLHTAGKEYEKSLAEMIYLEDDFNDNAYHFGAAFERYMMVNQVFIKRLEQCNEKLVSDRITNPKSYQQ